MEMKISILILILIMKGRGGEEDFCAVGYSFEEGDMGI